MPLHLLGKKSWNVYNQDNITKVRRDEAQAKAREEEQERRLQEVDAERRLQVLRGIQPGTPPGPQDDEQEVRATRVSEGRDRKRRRIAGEDDTDREIRLAREDAAALPDRNLIVKKPSADAPLTDHDGHINLFPAERPRHAEKNPEAEAEAAKKKREHEDQYTMRFSNAAGFKQGLENPWYSSTESKNATAQEGQGKNAWGNEDPRRRERDQMRIAANDPLAMIKKGVKQLREAEKDRQRWTEEKQREIKALEEGEERKKRRRRRRGSDHSLEGFELDAQTKHDAPRRKHAHHHRHRDGNRRSRSRERSRHHHS